MHELTAEQSHKLAQAGAKDWAKWRCVAPKAQINHKEVYSGLLDDPARPSVGALRALAHAGRELWDAWRKDYPDAPADLQPVWCDILSNTNVDDPSTSLLVRLARAGPELWNSWREAHSKAAVKFSRIELVYAPIDFSKFRFGDNATFEGAHFGSFANFELAEFGDNAKLRARGGLAARRDSLAHCLEFTQTSNARSLRVRRSLMGLDSEIPRTLKARSLTVVRSFLARTFLATQSLMGHSLETGPPLSARRSQATHPGERGLKSKLPPNIRSSTFHYLLVLVFLAV
jgi:hypothetical protein